MSKPDTQEKKEKITSAIRYSQKRGIHLAVMDMKTQSTLGHISEKEQHINEGLPPDQYAEVLAAFDNFKSILETNLPLDAMDKLNVRLPAKLKEHMLQAFILAAEKKVKFHPFRAMVQALQHETVKTLKALGIDPDLPDPREVKPSMHIEARKIFDKLLPEKDDFEAHERMKGFKSIFDKYAAEEFGKSVADLQYLYNYKRGKAKPAMWVYASALLTLNELGINVFNIGVSQELIFDLWYKANKEALDSDAIVEKFVKYFQPDEALQQSLKNYIKKIEQ